MVRCTNNKQSDQPTDRHDRHLTPRGAVVRLKAEDLRSYEKFTARGGAVWRSKAEHMRNLTPREPWCAQKQNTYGHMKKIKALGAVLRSMQKMYAHMKKITT